MNKKRFIFPLLLIFSLINIYSHPHAFTDVKFTIVSDKNGLTGIEAYWVMDDMFTSQVLYECDLNRNNVFDENEQDIVYVGFFENLVYYNYFTYINYQNEMFMPHQITNFRVKHETYQNLLDNNIISEAIFENIKKNSFSKISKSDFSGRLSYSFFIPYKHDFSKKGEIILSCFDETFFCDIRFIKDNSFGKKGNIEKFDIEYCKDIGIRIEYDNDIIGSTREGANYTGVARPDGLKISVK